MNFKAQIDKDISQVFHNSGEFAEMLYFYLDGEPRKAKGVLDYSEYNERRRGNNNQDKAEGIYNVDLIMYIALQDLGKLPRRGQELEINDEIYTIEKVKNEMGELTIHLKRLME